MKKLYYLTLCILAFLIILVPPFLRVRYSSLKNIETKREVHPSYSYLLPAQLYFTLSKYSWKA